MKQASSSHSSGLYLIRHGRTGHNADGRIRAWSDPPLDEVGKESAHKIGFQLRNKLDRLYSSDLLRGKQTANIVASSPWTSTPPEIEVSNELRPWHLGELTGKKISEVLEKLKYYAAHPDKQVPGGEAYRDFFNRWLKFLSEALEESKHEPIGIIGHHRHLLSLPTVLNTINGKRPDLGSIPVSNDWGPGAVLKISSGGEIEVLHKGEPEKAVS